MLGAQNKFLCAPGMHISQLREKRRGASHGEFNHDAMPSPIMVLFSCASAPAMV
jgi:hypothetical protein